MISLVIASVISFHGAAPTITLVRGGTVGDLPIWDVEDTTIDGTSPNENHGGEPVLSAGGARKMLVRFGDIARVVKPGQKIRSATLVLKPTGGGRPVLQSISAVKSAWGEGPYQTLADLTPPPPKTTPDGKPVKAPEPAPPKGSATWKERRAGSAGWQQAGAGGPSDTAPIAGAKLGGTDDQIRIEGLAAAVQAMADKPYENFGFALAFEGAAEVGSSQGRDGRPTLEIELEDETPLHGPDLSVISIARVGAGGKLPSPGENAKFVATVRNVGDADANGFSATWSLDEKAGGAQDNAQSLKPGQEITISYEAAYKPDKTDHRFQTVGLEIKAKGEDSNLRNNGLTVALGAKALEVGLSPEAYAGLKKLGVVPEDWVEETAGLFNDVYLGQSRYSFAADGALERIAIQKISEGSAPVMVSGNPSSLTEARLALLKQFALALGLTDRSISSVSPANNAMNGRGAEDRFPGLLGYGDTRFEGFLPGSIGLPYEPYASPLVDANPLEATGLLAATDVASINATLGGPALDLPKTIILRAADAGAVPLLSTQLAFFPLKDGKIAKDAQQAFSLQTGSGGNVLLPKPEGGLFPSGVTAYLVRASANGVQAFNWLKEWQLIDAASRGSRSAAIIDLRFALPGSPIDLGTDLAGDRIITDSVNSAPAQLAALIDGQNSTVSTLSGKVGDWVEIDLGRDRYVGGISLIGTPGEFWSKYDLVTYATGQRPEEAIVWSRELDGNWTFRNRRDVLTGTNQVSTPYYNQPRRFRYLRLINRSGGVGKLGEIRITPAVVNQ